MEPGNWDVGLPGGEKGVRDVLVVGGGPAGLTTSINAASDGLNVLFVEAQSKAGGQSKFSSRIENFPGWPVGLTGSVLAKRTYKQALRMGAEGMMGVRVTGITSDPTTGLKTATLSDGKQIKARAVVIAAGLESKPLSGVPGLDAKNVVYLEQADELSKISKGKPVVILGGANSAAQAALGVTDRASHVYLISRSPIAKGMSDYQVQAVKNHPKITIIEGDEIAKLETDKNNTPIEVVTKGGRKIPAGALGIFIGSGPKTEWLPAEIKRNDKGSILTNADYETDMPGVFAIGDNRVGGGGRINIATAEGQIVERNLFKYFESMKKQYSKTPATAVAAAKDDKRRRAKLKAEWADLLEELLKLDKQYPNLGQEALEDY
jgi:thioredoxin reductase (NADPH)